jgi:hypothetical protein
MIDKPIKADVQLGNNPKDKFGSKKVSVTKLPAVGILHGSMGMMYGASQYDPFNWRGNAVVASIYIDAMIRHLLAWFDQKEEIADDSGVTHLGHVIANAAIILDAQATGNLIDDRPPDGKTSVELTRLNALIPELQKRWADIKSKRLQEKEKSNV